MKKKMYLFGYATVLVAAISLQSCNDDPITPSDGSGNDTDTTWVEDSTDNNGGGDPTDTTGNGGGGNPSDTICWGGGNGDNGGNDGGGDPIGDSTNWNPYDSTNIGG